MSDESDSGDSDNFEVEEILDDRENTSLRRTEYLIKWLGFPNADNSWVPKENLTGATEILKKYLKKKNLSRSREKLAKSNRIRTKSKAKADGTTFDPNIFSTNGSDSEASQSDVSLVSNGPNCSRAIAMKKANKERIQLEKSKLKPIEPDAAEMPSTSSKRKSLVTTTSKSTTKKVQKKVESQLPTIQLSSESDDLSAANPSKQAEHKKRVRNDAEDKVVVDEPQIVDEQSQSGANPADVELDRNQLRQLLTDWDKFNAQSQRGFVADSQIEIYMPHTSAIPIVDLDVSVDVLFESDEPNHQELNRRELELQQKIFDDNKQSAIRRFSAAVKLGMGLAALKYLLTEEPNLDVDAADSHNVSLLHICAIRPCDDSHNFCHIAEFLVQSGCEVNRATSYGRVTPLMVAVHEAHDCMVKCLLDCGANPHLLDFQSNSALNIAICHADDRQSTINQLLVGGADYYQPTADNLTPLGLAELYRKDTTVQSFTWVQNKVREALKRTAEYYLSADFRMVRPLHRIVYQSVVVEGQKELIFDLPLNPNIKKNIRTGATSNFDVVMLIGSVRWQRKFELADRRVEWRKLGQFEGGLRHTDLSAMVSVYPDVLKGLMANLSLNGVKITPEELDDDTMLLKPTGWDVTRSNRLVFTPPPAEQQTRQKPILLAIQTWKVVKIY